MPSWTSSVARAACAFNSSKPPSAPMPAPTSGPSSTCLAANIVHPPSGAAPAGAAKAAIIRTSGKASPSFSPLSTVSARRWRSGTSLLLITASPSAASVGTRMAAISATMARGQPGNSSQPATQPKAKHSGIPITSIRTGQAL